jgi:hypothetical protein
MGNHLLVVALFGVVVVVLVDGFGVVLVVLDDDVGTVVVVSIVVTIRQQASSYCY